MTELIEQRQAERLAIIELAAERERYGYVGRLPNPIFDRRDEKTLLTYPRDSILYGLASVRLRIEILWLRLLREFPPFRFARWICEKVTMHVARWKRHDGSEDAQWR